MQAQKNVQQKELKRTGGNDKRSWDVLLWMHSMADGRGGEARGGEALLPG